MNNSDIVKKRRNILESISGNWESEEYFDSILKTKCRLLFTIDKKFGLSNFPIYVKATLKHPEIDKTELITIVFWWLNNILVLDLNDNNGGSIVVNPEKSELGIVKTLFSTQNKYNEKKVILRFNKVFHGEAIVC